MKQRMRQTWSAKITILIVAGIMALFGAGCTLVDKENKETRIQITSENFEKICGMQWILKEVTEDGKKIDLKGEPAFVQFQLDGKLSGFASINRFFGSLTIDEKGRLEFSKFGTTMMAGPEDLMGQEKRFLESVQKIDTLLFEGIHLYALSGDGNTALVFYVPVQ